MHCRENVGKGVNWGAQIYKLALVFGICQEILRSPATLKRSSAMVGGKAGDMSKRRRGSADGGSETDNSRMLAFMNFNLLDKNNSE